MRPLAEGVIIGGLANVIAEAIDMARSGEVAGTGEYFPAASADAQSLNAYGNTPSYQGANAFGGLYDGEAAFKADAWA